MQDDQFSNFLDFGIKNYLSKILVWIHLQEIKIQRQHKLQDTPPTLI